MKFLRQLFRGENGSTPSKTVQRLLARLKVEGGEELPQHYHEIVMEVSRGAFKPRLIFQELVAKISQMHTIAGVIKLFTIIFNLLRKTNYPFNYLQQLQSFNQLQSPRQQLINKHKWLRQLSCACITYLGRLSSISDIYERAQSFRAALIGPQIMQTDLFRLVNVYSMLVPLLSQSTNTVGRYFKDQIPFYDDFYKIMRSELLLGYYYMRYICNHYMTACSSIPINLLEFFNEIVPQVELLCDQMEDYFLNKHFRCSELGRRLYFKEEQLQQLRYHIWLRKNEGEEEQTEKKVDQNLKTSDSQGFEFKFNPSQIRMLSHLHN